MQSSRIEQHSIRGHKWNLSIRRGWRKIQDWILYSAVLYKKIRGILKIVFQVLSNSLAVQWEGSLRICIFPCQGWVSSLSQLIRMVQRK